MDAPVAEVFALIAEYHQVLGLSPLNAMSAPWMFRLSGFDFKVNGSNTVVDGVPPHHAQIAPTGYLLPLLLVGPGGGNWAGRNIEDEVIAALKAAIEARR